MSETNNENEGVGASGAEVVNEAPVVSPKSTSTSKKNTPFTQDQLEIIQSMLAQAREQGGDRRVDAVSMYNLRDPKAIESVNVKRIDGKFVIGFKNFQMDSFKKKPKYLQYKQDAARGLFKEPFITLMLSTDGKEVEEKEMMLVDYVNEREYFQAKVIEVKKKKIVEDHGLLGSSGEYATAVDDKNMPVARLAVKAEVELEERVFVVELPGFDTPVEFISDYLA